MKYNYHFKLHISNILFSLVPLIVKLVSISAIPITLGRCLSAIVCLWVISKRYIQEVSFSSREWIVLGFVSFLMCMSWVTYFVGIKSTSVALSIVLFNTHPLFTALIEPLCLRSKYYSFHEIITTIGVLIGIIVLVSGQINVNGAFIGVISCLASALTLSIRNCLIKAHLANVNSPFIMLCHCLCAILFLSPFFPDLFTASLIDWSGIIVLGCFVTAYAHSILVSSIQNSSAKTVGIITCLQPIYTICLGKIILDEPISIHIILGTIIIFITVFYESYTSIHK